MKKTYTMMSSSYPHFQSNQSITLLVNIICNYISLSYLYIIYNYISSSNLYIYIYMSYLYIYTYIHVRIPMTFPWSHPGQDGETLQVDVHDPSQLAQCKEHCRATGHGAFVVTGDAVRFCPQKVRWMVDGGWGEDPWCQMKRLEKLGW